MSPIIAARSERLSFNLDFASTTEVNDAAANSISARSSVAPQKWHIVDVESITCTQCGHRAKLSFLPKSISSLPDLYAFFRCEEHRVALLHIECGVKLRDVHDDSLQAEFRR
jgi:hypothetical protein